MEDGRDDLSLVLAARTGDDRAFAQLFERWFDRVFDVAWRIVRDREVAAEVAQDAFLTAWRRLDTLDQPASFGGWLLRIGRNGALNRLQRERRSIAMGDEQTAAEVDRRAEHRPVEATLEADEGAALVWAAADALGERDASLLDLHLRHGLGPAELADALGVTPNNAHQLLFRLRGRLSGAIRAWVLWNDGRPECADLGRALVAVPVERFGAPAVKAISRHAGGCEACAGRQRALLAPEALFAAVPIVGAGPLLKARAATALAAEGVPVTPGSAAPPGPGSGPAGTDLSIVGPDPTDGPAVDTGAPTAAVAATSGPAEPADPVDPEVVSTSTAARGDRRARIAALVVAALVLVALVVTALAVRDAGDGPSAAVADEPVPTLDAGPTSTVAVPEVEAPPSTVAPVDDVAVPGPAPAAPPASTVPPVAVPPSSPPVTVPPSTPPPTAPPAPPTISGFRATPGGAGCTSVQRAVTLVWQTTGADTVTITGPGVAATPRPDRGQVVVCLPAGPPGTATWVLTASGPGGSATRTATA